MTSYTNDDIIKGIGAFNQAMLAQTEIAGHAERMSAGLRIGIVSAAMRSGLPATPIDRVLEGHFAPDVTRLKKAIQMFEGDDWDVNLWHLLPTGRYKLCTDLCRPSAGGWKYDRGLASTDW